MKIGECDLFMNYKSQQRLYSFFDPSLKLYGFKNQNSQIVIEPMFERIENYASGFYCVGITRCGERVYGYIGRDGLFLPPKYSKADSFDKGFVYWHSNDFCYALRSGRMVDNRCVEKQVNGLMILNHSVTEDGLHKIINLCGEQVFTFPQDVYYEPSITDEDGYTKIIDNGGYYADWFIEPDGFVTRSKFDGTRELYAAAVGHKLCYINNNREIVIDADIYDEIFEFSSGLARVRKDEKNGFLDKEGCLVIPISLDSCEDFSEGSAFFRSRKNEPFSGSLETYDDLDSSVLIMEIQRAFISTLPEWLQKSIEECFAFFASNTGNILVSYMDEKYIIRVEVEKSEVEPGVSNITNVPEDSSILISELEYEISDDSSSEKMGNEELEFCYIEILQKFTQYCQFWGKIDTSGKVIAEPQMGPGRPGEDTPLPFLVLKSGEAKFGYVDHNWNFKIPPIYDRVDLFRSGIAAVYLNGKEGIINEDGEYQVKPEYDYLKFSTLMEHSNAPIDKFLAEKDGKSYMLDRSGAVKLESPQGSLEEIIPGIFEYGNLWENNVGIINSSGKIIMEIGKYHRFERMSDYYFLFRDDRELYGIANQTGVVISPRYNQIRESGEDLVWLCENVKQSLYDYELRQYIIDKDLNIFLLDKDIYIDKKYTEGLAVASNSGRFEGPWGFINANGSFVIPCIFSSAKSFHNGFAQVQINGGWGIIDLSGEFVIPPVLDDICGDFHNGIVWVVYIGQMYKMDIKGTLYDGTIAIGQISSPIPQKLGEKWGYINHGGEFIIPAIYDKAEYFNLDFAKVRQGDWNVVINNEGKLILAELIYEGKNANDNNY